MTYRTRLKYTDEMRSFIWDRYQLGDSVKSIGLSKSTCSEDRFVSGAAAPERQLKRQNYSWLKY